MSGAARRAVLVLSTLALASGACAGKGSAFGPTRVKLGYGLEQGNARLPATARGATLSYLSYSDYNGLLGKLLFYSLTAPQPQVTHVSTVRSCSAASCTVTTYYSVRPPKEEDVARFTAMVASVEQHGHPIEANVIIPMRSLGGEGSGWSLEMLFKGWRGFRGQLIELAGGVNISDFEYANLTVRDGAFPFAGDVMRTYSFHEFGVPLRVAWYVSPAVSFYLRHDLNVLGLLRLVDDDERAPSLTTLGVRAHLPVLELRAGLLTDSFHPESATMSLEAALAF